MDRTVRVWDIRRDPAYLATLHAPPGDQGQVHAIVATTTTGSTAASASEEEEAGVYVFVGSDATGKNTINQYSNREPLAPPTPTHQPARPEGAEGEEAARMALRMGYTQPRLWAPGILHRALNPPQPPLREAVQLEDPDFHRLVTGPADEIELEGTVEEASTEGEPLVPKAEARREKAGGMSLMRAAQNAAANIDALEAGALARMAR